MVNDGTVSRLDIATIILGDDDDDIAPILGIYDHAFAQTEAYKKKYGKTII